MSSTSETATVNGTNGSAGETSTKATTPISNDDPLIYKRKLVRSPSKTNPLKYKVWLAGHISMLVLGQFHLFSKFYGCLIIIISIPSVIDWV